MKNIIKQLKAAGEQHKGSDLGGLLQWAALQAAKAAAEAALAAINAGLFVPVELSRDYTGHINLMAGHGDPDYLMKNGRSVRHVDLRSTGGRP